MSKPVRSMRVRSLHPDFAPVGTERQMSMADGLLLVRIGRAAAVEEKPAKQLDEDKTQDDTALTQDVMITRSMTQDIPQDAKPKQEEQLQYKHRQMTAKQPRKG